MKKSRLLFLFCFVGCLSVSGTLIGQIQPLTGNEVPGMIVADTETFTPEMVRNYYNSDQAPLLSEFGMTRLLVQKFQIDQQNFKLEAYLMNTPEGAFGMYTLNLMTCLAQDTLSRWDCLTRNQYISAYGRVYLIITNANGSEAEQESCLQIARAFYSLNPQESLTLPKIFSAPAFDGNINQIDYLQGLNGMQNSLLPWQSLILKVRYAMYAVMLPDPRGEIYFAQVSFPTRVDMMNFLTLANLVQQGMPVQSYWNNAFLFREFVPVDSPESLTIWFLQCIQPVAIAEITSR